MLESQFGSAEAGSRKLKTPSKERIVFSPGFGNEENEENSIVPADQQGQSKRPKLGSPTQSKMVSRTMRTNLNAECGSECGTEASSTVLARREWLKDFGRQHENTFPKRTSGNTELFKSPSRKTPLTSSRQGLSASTSSAAASVLVTKLVSGPKKFSTPVRTKPRTTQKEEVQATNEGYASVAKLSEWLANDPTSTKKKKHVRRGRNVINKSRQFEKDREDVIVIESNISRGAVSDRKKWLKEAFHESEVGEGVGGGGSIKTQLPRYAKTEVGACDNASSISVSDKKDWLKRAFKNRDNVNQENKNTSSEESRCQIITDDAASSLSVSDKKDWLKNAFKKTEGSRKAAAAASVPYPKAQSDILHLRGANVEDAASRAKRKFLERSCRSKNGTPQKAKPTMVSGRSPQKSAGVLASDTQERGTSSQMAGRDNAGNYDQNIKVAESRDPPPLSLDGATTRNVEEDTTPVDFSNARKFLIQRSRKNGHNAQVVNKVFLRRNKFEKLEQDNLRRSGPKGLLKTSWAQADTKADRPSHGAYEKTYVSDIAPKRSFEELP